MKFVLSAIAVIVLLASQATGQELRSLEDAIAQGAEKTYALVRCAGLYTATAEWVGENRAGTEAWAALNAVVENLEHIRV